MYHTTGFSKDEIIDLCALVYANEENCDIDTWPPSLGLYKSVVIATASASWWFEVVRYRW